MKVAVIQHMLREAAMDDMSAVVDAVRTAHERGAELVVLPEIPSVNEDEDARWYLNDGLEKVPCVRLMPYGGQGWEGAAFVVENPTDDGRLGVVAVLVGDQVFERENWEGVALTEAGVLVLCPRSENDLQAEAVLELALQLSDSVAGLVIVAECDGGEVGEAGHGGSAIISVGEVVAEAMSGDDMLMTELELPPVQPEPREPLPELSTLLAQRLANHGGAKVAVDYPADLSDGAGPD